MWDAISKVLTNENAIPVLIFGMFVCILGAHLLRVGVLQINTGKFQLGADVRERDIIRQQVEWAHTYISGLYSQIKPVDEDYNGYFTKYILEVIYSEVVDWITFNHIKIDSDYISIKQAKIKAIVYSYNVKPEFRTQKFQNQIDAWVEDTIKKLVVIREVYK